MKFCNALREGENNIKWRDGVAGSVAPQRSPLLQDRCKVQDARSKAKTLKLRYRKSYYLSLINDRLY